MMKDHLSERFVFHSEQFGHENDIFDRADHVLISQHHQTHCEFLSHVAMGLFNVSLKELMKIVHQELQILFVEI